MRCSLDNDDDKWIFDPSNDVLMDEYYSNKRPWIGGGATPLLDFQLRPLGARRNWRNVLNKQRFEARIQQHRDATPSDDLGREVTEALRRTIRRQIEADSTLTPHSTLHFVMQSDAFNHAFQSTTFTVREFEEGSVRLDTYLQTPAQKRTFHLTIPLVWRPLLSIRLVLGVVMGKSSVQVEKPWRPCWPARNQWW